MTSFEIKEAHDSFIAEREAILLFDSGLVYQPGEVEAEAERLWLQYKRDFKVFANEQKGLI